MVETNPIHPDVRRFAIETEAEKVKPMESDGAGRVVYDDSSVNIIGLGDWSDIPEGFGANLTFSPTPTIDLFPR